MVWDAGFIAAAASVLGLLFGARWWEKRENAAREPTESELLFVLARISETSEFEQFRRAAADWRISEQRVENDFRHYLRQGRLPHYVRDYLRRARVADPELPHKGAASFTGVLVQTEENSSRAP